MHFQRVLALMRRVELRRPWASWRSRAIASVSSATVPQGVAQASDASTARPRNATWCDGPISTTRLIWPRAAASRA